MKILYSGLLFFSIVPLVYSKTTFNESRTGILLLRGRVPASTQIEWNKSDVKAVPKVTSNGPGILPKLIVQEKKHHRQLTIIHP